MKAQFIYENLDFERGIDPKHSIGIGKRALIDRWFEEWAPDAEYEVDANLNIEIKGGLNLNNTPITSLPDNLSVGGYLNLRNTQITSLPDNLNIEG